MKKKLQVVILVFCMIFMLYPSFTAQAEGVTVNDPEVEITGYEYIWSYGYDLCYINIYTPIFKNNYVQIRGKITQQVIEPTCTEQGYTQYTADFSGRTTGYGDDGHIYFEIEPSYRYSDYTLPLGHNYENGICTSCQAVCTHTWTQEVTKASTCTETGILTLTCSECGMTKKEEIAKIEHNYVNGICSYCGASDGSQTSDDSSQTGGSTETGDSTETGGSAETGDSSQTGGSAETGDSTQTGGSSQTGNSGENTEAHVHNYLVTYSYAPDYSTCTATYTCNTCGASGAVLKECSSKNEVSPTDDSNGYITFSYYLTEVVVPSGVTLKDQSVQKTLPALGHTYDEGVITKEPTCTEAGVKTYTCENKNCGKTYTEAIPTIDHNYKNGVCTYCSAADPSYVKPTPQKTTVVNNTPTAKTNDTPSTGTTVTAQTAPQVTQTVTPTTEPTKSVPKVAAQPQTENKVTTKVNTKKTTAIKTTKTKQTTKTPVKTTQKAENASDELTQEENISEDSIVVEENTDENLTEYVEESYASNITETTEDTPVFKVAVYSGHVESPSHEKKTVAEDTQTVEIPSNAVVLNGKVEETVHTSNEDSGILGKTKERISGFVDDFKSLYGLIKKRI